MRVLNSSCLFLCFAMVVSASGAPHLRVRKGTMPLLNGVLRTNSIRSKASLTIVRPDATLKRLAQEMANEIARTGVMSHKNEAGKGVKERVLDPYPKYSFACENLAAGFDDCKPLFEAWMNSEKHRENLLSDLGNRFGIASARNAAGRRYWVMIIAREAATRKR